MGGTAVGVDIIAVGAVVHDIGLGAQRVEHALGDAPSSAVRAVETYLDALEAVLAHGDQVADVTVTTLDIVNGSADILALSDRDIDLAVNVFFDLQQGLFLHLLTVAVEHLDTVVIERIVRGGDHDTAVEVVDAGDVSDRRGGGDVHDVSVSAACHQTGAQRVLEHIRRTSGVLTDQHLCFFALIRAVVPAEETTDLDGVIEGQILVCFTAEAVCTEIFTHGNYLFSTISPLFFQMQFSGTTPRTQEVG